MPSYERFLLRSHYGVGDRIVKKSYILGFWGCGSEPQSTRLVLLYLFMDSVYKIKQV